MDTALTASRAVPRHKWPPRALSLGGLPLSTLLRRVWSSANDDDIIDRAAELAYYFLFALVPSLIFLSAMFGLFAATRVQSNLDLMLYLAKVIPPMAFSMVAGALTTTTKASNTTHLAFGAITALWAATYGMSSAQTILNVIYGKKESRPYWKAKAIAILLTLAIFVLVFSAMLLLILGDYLAALLVHALLVNWYILVAWKAIQLVASLSFMFMVFALTYHWGPDRRDHKWRWISPGSMVGVLGWVAMSMAFRVYLQFFNPYATTYGSFGAVIVLLTWFYVSGLMLLLGAEINAAIERAGIERAGIQPVAPASRWDAPTS